jgi:cation-transporting ATPase 13A3/4/5
VAAKSFPKLSWIKAQRLTRSQVESELRFIGFVIFENKLKLGTEPAIQILKSAHIGVRMCTGDNIRTAISVGRDCGMIEESMRVYLPTFTSGTCFFIISISADRNADQR